MAPTAEKTEQPVFTAADLAAALKEAMGGVAESIKAGQPRKKMDFDEYVRKHATAGPKLVCTVFQNGYPCRAEDMRPEEVEVANQLFKTAKSGRYMKRYVELIVKRDDGAAEMQIRYKDATANDRLVQKSHFSSFGDLMQKLLDAQEPKAKKA